MSTQPEALWLAEYVENHWPMDREMDLRVATELRRLHEVNAELLNEFKQVMRWINNWEPEFIYDPDWKVDGEKAKAAIAKATGEQQ
jgi:hypothetical protein